MEPNNPHASVIVWLITNICEVLNECAQILDVTIGKAEDPTKTGNTKATKDNRISGAEGPHFNEDTVIAAVAIPPGRDCVDTFCSHSISTTLVVRGVKIGNN